MKRVIASVIGSLAALILCMAPVSAQAPTVTAPGLLGLVGQSANPICFIGKTFGVTITGVSQGVATDGTTLTFVRAWVWNMGQQPDYPLSALGLMDASGRLYEDVHLDYRSAYDARVRALGVQKDEYATIQPGLSIDTLFIYSLPTTAEGLAPASPSTCR